MLRYFLQLLTFWLIIYALHSVLLLPRTYHSSTLLDTIQRTYQRCLRTSGCQISLFYLGFYSTSFNRFFYWIARRLRSFWPIWFNFGIIVTLFTALIASITLIVLPLQSLAKFSPKSIDAKETIDRDRFALQPIIPGVTLPIEQMGHFLSALIVCTIFHEMGHAIAAAMERVQIHGWGGFVYFIYPGAYVDLNPEQVEMLSNWQQLRIYCAGVFHNIILVILAFLLLLLHPVFLRTCYIEVANVYQVAKNSPVYHLLPVHSRIHSIDHCPVQTSADWSQCVRSIHARHPLESSGYCLTSSQIQLLSTHLASNQNTSFDCCENQSTKNYCFLYQSSSSLQRMGACLEVRKVIEYPSCLHNDDCKTIDQSVCLQPFSSDNRTRLISIEHSDGPVILFLGSIEEISRTVLIQSYQSNSVFFPDLFVTDLPLFIQYIAAISFALAFFNAVPCHAFDGQYILFALFPNAPRYLLFIGTILVMGNISLALLAYFLSI